MLEPKVWNPHGNHTYRHQTHVKHLALLQVCFLLKCELVSNEDEQTQANLTPVNAARLKKRNAVAKVDTEPDELSIPIEHFDNSAVTFSSVLYALLSVQ
jgi:hypothetical protein